MSQAEKLEDPMLNAQRKKQRKSSKAAAVKVFVMPPMETAEQQEILKLKEQLEKEKKDHEETKSKLPQKDFVIEKLKTHIHYLEAQAQHTDEQMKLMEKEHLEKLQEKKDPTPILELNSGQVNELLEAFNMKQKEVDTLRNEVADLHGKNGELLKESEEMRKLLEAREDDDLKNLKKTEEKDQKIRELTDVLAATKKLSLKQSEEGMKFVDHCAKESEKLKETQRLQEICLQKALIGEAEKDQKIRILTVCAEKDADEISTLKRENEELEEKIKNQETNETIKDHTIEDLIQCIEKNNLVVSFDSNVVKNKEDLKEYLEAMGAAYKQNRDLEQLRADTQELVEEQIERNTQNLNNHPEGSRVIQKSSRTTNHPDPLVPMLLIFFAPLMFFVLIAVLRSL